MLGSAIHDPEAIEAAAGSSAGLGFFDMQTTLTAEKILRNVQGKHIHSGAAVSGYEIHAGLSSGPALEQPVFSLQRETDQQPFDDGAMHQSGQIMGSYLHGLFDSAELLQYIIEWAGIAEASEFDYQAYRKEEIDRLADAVEAALPLSDLLQLLSLPDAANAAAKSHKIHQSE